MLNYNVSDIHHGEWILVFFWHQRAERRIAMKWGKRGNGLMDYCKLCFKVTQQLSSAEIRQSSLRLFWSHCTNLQISMTAYTLLLLKVPRETPALRALCWDAFKQWRSERRTIQLTTNCFEVCKMFHTCSFSFYCVEVYKTNWTYWAVSLQTWDEKKKKSSWKRWCTKRFIKTLIEQAASCFKYSCGDLMVLGRIQCDTKEDYWLDLTHGFANHCLTLILLGKEVLGCGFV